jgi:hypothetical protein
MPTTHTLIVTCGGSCDGVADGGTCDCGIFGDLTLVCSAEDGVSPIDCGTLEECGCMPRPYGPRTETGQLSTLILANGDILNPDLLDDYRWVQDIAPTCPHTGRPHHAWEGMVMTSSHECFARQCAEYYDVEQFSELDITEPGRYSLVYTVTVDSSCEWELAAPVEAAA